MCTRRQIPWIGNIKSCVGVHAPHEQLTVKQVEKSKWCSNQFNFSLINWWRLFWLIWYLKLFLSFEISWFKMINAKVWLLTLLTFLFWLFGFIDLNKKLWKPGDIGLWKIWKRRFFQDILNSFWLATDIGIKTNQNDFRKKFQQLRSLELYKFWAEMSLCGQADGAMAKILPSN